MQAGAMAVLGKPFDTGQLLRPVREALRASSRLIALAQRLTAVTPYQGLRRVTTGRCQSWAHLI